MYGSKLKWKLKIVISNAIKGLPLTCVPYLRYLNPVNKTEHWN